MGLGLQPIYPTREFPPPTVTARSLGPLGNRAAGQALVALGSPVLAAQVKELRAELGLPRLGSWQAVFGQQAACRWPAFHWPAFHGFSPAVVPRPADWRNGLEVTGYWWPPRPPDWHPPAGLEHFLADGPPPVFVGFGSMEPADPARLSEIVATAGQQAVVRLVIQAGQAGLSQASQGLRRGDWPASVRVGVAAGEHDEPPGRAHLLHGQTSITVSVCHSATGAQVSAMRDRLARDEIHPVSSDLGVAVSLDCRVR